MNRISFPLLTLLAATAWVNTGSAQQPPTPPAPGGPPPPPPGLANGLTEPMAQPTYSRRGTIKAFNSAPNGETNGIILSDGTTVFFPPEMGEQFRSGMREGARVAFTGVSRRGGANRMVVDAQTITANGQTFTAALAPPPPPDGGVAGPPAPPNGPRAVDGGRGRGGRGPGPVLAGGSPPPAAGCPPPPPLPPGR